MAPRYLLVSSYSADDCQVAIEVGFAVFPLHSFKPFTQLVML
jgi:hypothetical protein